MRVRTLLFLLAIVAAASASKGVDEALLVPHALDAAETSDSEILDSLNADEETTAATTSSTTSSTTTSSTTTTSSSSSTTSTTAATTLAPESRFSLATRALLRTYRLSARKLALAGYTDERARALVARVLRRQALAKARQEERAALAREKRALRARARARRLARLAAKKAREADYIPDPLKHAMSAFGFSWKAAEYRHEPIAQIKKELWAKEREDEAAVALAEKSESELVAAEMSKELAEGLKGPLAEERRVAALEKKYEHDLWVARTTGRKREARVLDSVKRRQRRLASRLHEDEIAIEQAAERAEKEAEHKARVTARELRETASKDVEETEAGIVAVAKKASAVSRAAQHWLHDQEEPAIAAFIAKEKSLLNERLLDVKAKARVKRISLRKRLKGV